MCRTTTPIVLKKCNILEGPVLALDGLRNVLITNAGLVGLVDFGWLVLSEIVTWLILPVVICLSQRLSHACLSLSNKRWNCEWLIKSVIVYLMVPYYMDNCGNSRANTCRKISTSGRDVFIRSKASGLRVSLVNHDNCSNRMALRRRCFIQISALSTFDGRIEAYHGDDG